MKGRKRNRGGRHEKRDVGYESVLALKTTLANGNPERGGTKGNWEAGLHHPFRRWFLRRTCRVCGGARKDEAEGRSVAVMRPDGARGMRRPFYGRKRVSFVRNWKSLRARMRLRQNGDQGRFASTHNLGGLTVTGSSTRKKRLDSDKNR